MFTSQFDSRGFNAKYCFYTIIQTGTKKVLAFTVCTKDMVPFSAMMGELRKVTHTNSLLILLIV
jgi:hypothetical protein